MVDGGGALIGDGSSFDGGVPSCLPFSIQDEFRLSDHPQIVMG